MEVGVGLAVVQLAGQLYTGILGLRQFFRDAKGVLDELARLASELERTERILKKFEKSRHDDLTAEDIRLMEDLSKECEEALRELLSLVNQWVVECEEGKVKRVVRSVKAALDQDKVTQCQERLTRLLGHVGLLGNLQVLEKQEKLSSRILERQLIDEARNKRLEEVLELVEKFDLPLCLPDNLRAFLTPPPTYELVQQSANINPPSSVESTSISTDSTIVMSAKAGDYVYSPSPLLDSRPTTKQRSIGAVIKSRSVVERSEETYFALLAIIHCRSEVVQTETLYDEDEAKDGGSVWQGRSAERKLETSYTIVPKLWIFNWLWNKGVSFSRSTNPGTGSLGVNFRSFNPRPDESSIFELCSRGNYEGVKSLLDKGEASPIDTNPDGWTPLHCAAYAHNLAICKLLVDNGAGTNILDFQNVSPLHLALSRLPGSVPGMEGQSEIPIYTDGQVPDVIRFLVRHGADPTFETDTGENCFDLITSRALKWPPSLLLWLVRSCQYGPDPNHRGPNGLTALMNVFFMLLASHTDLDELLSLNADINGRYQGLALDEDQYDAGWTPLHIAVLHLFPKKADAQSLAIRRDRVEYLVSRGADPHALSDRGETPTDVALRFGSSARFRTWCTILQESGYDLREFAKKEIEMHADVRWYAMNWCDYYLIALLELDDEPEDELMDIVTTGPFAERDRLPMWGEPADAGHVLEDDSDSDDEFREFLNSLVADWRPSTVMEKRREMRADLKRKRTPQVPGQSEWDMDASAVTVGAATT
ncbi:MAG: hypothetical protein M1823_001108 [Watsoniomyces obsoletus]|nr:MAG: hypothetical protein M1823_001108 [Watsoniomyces obsoletus]